MCCRIFKIKFKHSHTHTHTNTLTFTSTCNRSWTTKSMQSKNRIISTIFKGPWDCELNFDREFVVYEFLEKKINIFEMQNKNCVEFTWCDALDGCSVAMGSMVVREYDLRARNRNLLVKFDNDDNDAENWMRLVFVVECVFDCCSSCAVWFALRLIELPMKLANDAFNYGHSEYNMKWQNKNGFFFFSFHFKIHGWLIQW